MRLKKIVKHCLTVCSKEYRVVKDSALFDSNFYLSKYPDVAVAGIDPLVHFLRIGIREMRNPNALFNVEYYLAQNGGNIKITNPLLHYLRYGEVSSINPHVLFDSAYYLGQMDQQSIVRWKNPLAHYLKAESASLLDPHPLFDSEYFFGQVPETFKGKCNSNPLVMYLSNRELWEVSPHPLFDTYFYRGKYLSGEDISLPLLQHYLLNHEKTELDPNPYFSGNWYSSTEVKTGVSPLSPLTHYVTAGMFEGREPLPPSQKNLRDISVLILVVLDDFGDLEEDCINVIAKLQWPNIRVILSVPEEFRGRIDSFSCDVNRAENTNAIFYADPADFRNVISSTNIDSLEDLVVIVQMPILLHDNFVNVLQKYYRSYPDTELFCSDHSLLGIGGEIKFSRKPLRSHRLDCTEAYVDDLAVVSKSFLMSLSQSSLIELMKGRGEISSCLCKFASTAIHIPYSLYSKNERTEGGNVDIGCKSEGSSKDLYSVSFIVAIQDKNDFGSCDFQTLEQVALAQNGEIILTCYDEHEDNALVLADTYSSIKVVLQRREVQISHPVMLNRASKEAKGDWLIILEPDRPMFDAGYFRVLSDLDNCDKTVILGLQTIEKDSPVMDSTSQLLLRKVYGPGGSEASWSTGSSEEKVIVCEKPVVRLHGMSVRRTFFFDIGCFNTLYERAYFDFDLCMRAQHRQRNSVVEAVFLSSSVDVSWGRDNNERQTLDRHLFNDSWKADFVRMTKPASPLFDLGGVYEKKRNEVCGVIDSLKLI